MLLRKVGRLFSTSAIIFVAGTACAQDYPDRPIRLVTLSVGGGNDFLARLIAPGLSTTFNQPVIVDNRGGIVPQQIVAAAPADGYTLLVGGASLWIGPLLEPAPYDPVKDFTPIILVGSSPSILVVHSSVPVNSVKELIALAKAEPGKLNYASAAAGTANHLGAELFKAMAGVNIVRISYKGTGPAVNDLIGGQVQLMFGNVSAVMPHVKSGKLKALAVTSLKPSALVPGVPTVAASGLPGYQVISADSVFGPAKVPSVIVNRLNQEIARVINKPDVKEKLFNIGTEVVASSPAQLAAYIKADMAKIGKLIKEAGIKAD